MVKIFKTILKSELTILWIFSVLLGIALITLDINHRLPLAKGDFVFFSILALCVALYRPRWAFFLFISLVPLENIILASGFLPIQLRPYQFAGAILALAMLILSIFRKSRINWHKPTWLDWLIISLVPFGFLSLLNSPNKGISLKNDLVLLSFVVLFYLIRNFLRSREDFVKSIIFFSGSNLVVLFFGFFQVFADKLGTSSFEVMLGRPNSTFTEPDWLGIFLCFSLAVYFSSIFFLKKNTEKIFLYALIFLNLALLILTVSRSAWIGAAAIIFFFLLLNLFGKEEEKLFFSPRNFANQLLIVLALSAISFFAVQFGHLSKFDILDRARSAATSEQKITIACNDSANIPRIISNTSELAQYHCQHIGLEDIKSFQVKGKFVTEIYRKDPNVMTRSQIYGKSFEIIRSHPILGVGFGTITTSLGTDERGAGLNESNIFLQIWAGSGIFGLMAFMTAIAYVFIFSFRRISPVCLLNKIIGSPALGDNFEKNANKFVFLGLFAVIIPNLFNAGLFMGMLWLSLGIFFSLIDSNRPQKQNLID